MHLVGQGEGRTYQVRHVIGRRFEYTDPGTEDWRPIWLTKDIGGLKILSTDPTVIWDPNLPRDTPRAIRLKKGRHLVMHARRQKEDVRAATAVPTIGVIPSTLTFT